MTQRAPVHVAVITLDSLRFDAAVLARTPGFDTLFRHFSRERSWVRVYSQGTYTLPSHLSMLHFGKFPGDRSLPFPYDGGATRAIFQMPVRWNRAKPAFFSLPEAENVVRGFARLGYRTLGIGGVSWFDESFQSSALWSRDYFAEFHWRPELHSEDPAGFAHQVQLAADLLARGTPDRPLFFFLNVAATHAPFCGHGRSVAGQARALEEVDRHIDGLLGLLPRPCLVILVGDHGECFGEDGLWGHGFYHPKVMEVPMIVLELGDTGLAWSP